MGNLKFPFSTPESTKRLVRTVSSTLKRRLSDETRDCLLQPSSSSNSQTCSSSAGITNPLLSQDLQDLDDDTFEDAPGDNLNSSCSSSSDNDSDGESLHEAASRDSQDVLDHGSSSSELRDYLPATMVGGGVAAAYQHLMMQQTSLYRNLDLITSTPSVLLGRRSMSPITKSTQRMPKAMQVSCLKLFNYYLQ